MDLPTFDRVRQQFLLRLHSSSSPSRVSSGRPDSSSGSSSSSSGSSSSSSQGRLVSSPGSPLRSSPKVALFLASVESFGITRTTCLDACRRYLRNYGNFRFDISVEDGEGQGENSPRCATQFYAHLLELARTPMRSSATPSCDDFVWPLVEMASFEFGSRNREGADMANVVVLINVPKLGPRKRREFKSFLVHTFISRFRCRSAFVHMPKEPLSGAACAFIMLPTANEARMIAEELNRVVWPSGGGLQDLVKEICLEDWESPSDFCSFSRWQARLFTQYSKSEEPRRGAIASTEHKQPHRVGISSVESKRKDDRGHVRQLRVETNETSREVRELREKNALLTNQLLEMKEELKRETAERKVAEWAVELRENECITVAVDRLTRLSQITFVQLEDDLLMALEANLKCIQLRVQSAREELRLQREREQQLNGGAGACCICKERRRTILLLPCRHFCCCEPCAKHKDLRHCPICRCQIIEEFLVYDS